MTGGLDLPFVSVYTMAKVLGTALKCGESLRRPRGSGRRPAVGGARTPPPSVCAGGKEVGHLTRGGASRF